MLKLIFMFVILLILLIGVIYVINNKNKTNKNFQKIGIVSMMKDPHHIETWIKHHINMGINKLYLFIDDPNDKCINTINNLLQLSDYRNKIRMIIIDDAWKKKNNYKKDPKKDEPLNWNVKQDMCVNNALSIAKLDDIEVLIHIDADELLYSQNNKKINEIFSMDYNTFKLKNYEMAPERDNYKNCFLENHYFRKHGINYIAYGNGKGAGVVGKVRSNGPHEMISTIRFRLFKSIHQKYIHENDLVVLHFVSCNVEEMLKKYKFYSNFSTNGWEWAKIHLESRDKLKNCYNSKECEKIAKDLFKKRILSPLDNKNNILNVNLQ